MVLATTRSSRLFVVLLHLVGVSTRIRRPQQLFASLLLPQAWNATATATTVGIQGVHSHPSSILLEVSDPSLQNLDEIIQPHWLQDAQDQKCLGPMGSWAECGDSTIWRIIPNTRRHARRRQWIRWATEEEDVDTNMMERPQSYALQLMDDMDSRRRIIENAAVQNRSAATAVTAAALSVTDDFQERECLSRRRKDNKLVLVSCTEDRAWFWKVNENGILHFDKPLRGLRSDSRNKNPSKKRLLNKKQTLECLWRNESEAMLRPCDGRVYNNEESDMTNGKAVQMQFVRQKKQESVASSSAAGETVVHATGDEKNLGHGTTKDHGEERTQNRSNRHRKDSSDRTVPASRKGLPSQVDIAHVHASTGSSDNTEPRLASRSTSFLPHQSPDLVAKELPRYLGYSNPILVISKQRNSSSKKEEQNLSSQARVHETSLSPEKPILRKIPINPYIATSKDERWTDPQTGLVYHTDLCRYLGHERQEAGRHTLTGVGQYTKTMLNIKVYGVGFFVSKRDVLADPIVEQYASLSSEELRASPEFFEVLRKMHGFSDGDGPAGSFDRTLFLKTNMQLATETMRSSLDADWRMLTQEAKDLLIGSSMEPRPAGAQTLDIIESSDNPNRCSCAQIAPEEYNADPTCCARGTDLVFTWRKNGNLEIRLNGMFMDSFPRPDIAEGIFYEYLRTDNPMSVDFLDRVVEGFPFLLAPLSQVKGVTSPVVSHQAIHHDTHSSGNPLVRTIGGFGGAISSQAANFADFLQSGAHEISANAMETAKSVGSAARNLGDELERKRELIGKHISTVTNQAMSSFYPKDQKSLSIPYEWISDRELSRISGKLFKESKEETPAETGRFAQAVCRSLGLEECSLSATIAAWKLLGLVHLYLLLLLIASFPAQWTTRTKLIATKRASPNSSHASSESDTSDSEGSGENSVGVHDAAATSGNDLRIQNRIFVM